MTQRIPIGLSVMWSAPSFLFLLLIHFANGQGNEKEIKVLNIFIRGFCTLVTNLQKVEFEETLGGMVEAMTEIQGRADSMMEEIKAREVGEQLFGFYADSEPNIFLSNSVISWTIACSEAVERAWKGAGADSWAGGGGATDARQDGAREDGAAGRPDPCCGDGDIKLSESKPR